MTHTPNRLDRQLERLQEVPAFARPWFRSVVMGRAVPFTGTAKLRYEEMSVSTTKGEVTVPVTVTDESGNQPIACEFIWAWVPSQRPPKTETTKNDIQCP
ncbi:MAG: hypothetical protein ACK5A0_06910 [Polaromonas sp.]|jgi:hypothetical protein